MNILGSIHSSNPSLPPSDRNIYQSVPVSFSTISSFIANVSRNGKYVAFKLVLSTNATVYYIYISSNNGISYNLVNTSETQSFGIDMTDICISNDGAIVAHMVFSATNTMSISISTNSGSTFANTATTASTFRYPDICMSSTGQYICYETNDNGSYGTVNVSNNYGASWTSFQYNVAPAYPYGVAMDDSGQYIMVAVATSNPGTFRLSTNYGVSFSQVATLNGYGTMVYISGNAGFMAVGAGYGANLITYSTDKFMTSTVQNSLNSRMSLNGSKSWFVTNSDNSNIFYIDTANSSRIYVSSNNLASSLVYDSTITNITLFRGSSDSKYIFVRGTYNATVSVYMIVNKNI